MKPDSDGNVTFKNFKETFRKKKDESLGNIVLLNANCTSNLLNKSMWKSEKTAN